jgi:hypothetical protein
MPPHGTPDSPHLLKPHRIKPLQYHTLEKGSHLWILGPISRILVWIRGGRGNGGGGVPLPSSPLGGVHRTQLGKLGK